MDFAKSLDSLADALAAPGIGAIFAQLYAQYGVSVACAGIERDTRRVRAAARQGIEHCEHSVSHRRGALTSLIEKPNYAAHATFLKLLLGKSTVSMVQPLA